MVTKTTKTTAKKAAPKTEAKANATANPFAAYGDFLKGFAAVPAFDLQKVIEAHNKNIKAVVEANRVSYEGFKAIAERQVEIARDDIADVTEVVRGAFTTKPELDVTKRVEAAKEVATRKFSQARELAEATTKVNQDAFGILKTRFAEGVAEVRAIAS